MTTYREAGVDVEKGDALVDRIAPLAKSTLRPEVLAGIGGFASLCALPSRYKDPVLVSSTDGVGTKLKVAFLLGKHDTVGIDLVAMVVNDLVTTGAEPLFLLDYFATGALELSVGEAVIRGIAAGCKEAGCALVGGETAEMPGFYPPGEYDLAGFGVGVVERGKAIDGSKGKAGDALVAIASTGLHSNGFSLVRRALFPPGADSTEVATQRNAALGGVPLGDALLTPTRIYARLALALASKLDVKGLAHITGGGIAGNLPRVFPTKLKAVVDSRTWPLPPIFELVREAGGVTRDEMFKTFNMGIGMIAIVPPGAVDEVLAVAKEHGDRAWRCGELKPRTSGDPDCEIV